MESVRVQMNREEFTKKMDEVFEQVGITVQKGAKLEADSLQYVYLISSIEETFDVTLPDEFLTFSSVNNTDAFLDLLYDTISKK